MGNKIYENGELKKILVDGGYYDYQKQEYFFYIQDHLGNNRVVVNQNDSVVQRSDYYPFGMEFANNSGNNQPYKYNGKELDKMHGLNMYDYSARYVDPTYGRFTSVDPLAEMYYSISPYAYVGNNPIKFIDPTGMYWVDDESRDYAFELRSNMYRRISSYKKERTSKVEAILKDLQDGKTIKEEKFEEINSLSESISDLWEGTAELIQMELDADQGFAFKKTGGNVGGTDIRPNNVIEMEISGNGSSDNGVHESSHGYDLWKRGTDTDKNWDIGEIKAYGRQYSYNRSMPASYWGSVKNRCDITSSWVLRVYSFKDGSKNYLYADRLMSSYKKIFTPSEIEKMLDQARKNK